MGSPHSGSQTAVLMQFWLNGVYCVDVLTGEVEGGVARVVFCLEASRLQMHKMCAKMEIGQCDAGNSGIK
jgi:hypothetical protein